MANTACKARGREVAVGVGAAHQVVERVHVPVFHGDHGHDLLGQHVQRIARGVDRLHVAPQHAAGHRGGLHHILPVGGEDAPAGGLAHQVAGAPDPLQALGHRLGRLELHHQIHRADVDAQLQRRGAHQRRQVARLERLLQGQARLLGHAAVVRADWVGMRPAPGPKHPDPLGHAAFDQRVGAERILCPSPHPPPSLTVGARLPPASPLARHLLVDPVGGALGQAAVVDEDEGGAVLADEIHHPRAR